LAALPATSSDLTESYPKPLRQRRPWSGGSSWLEVAEQTAGERGKALLLARARVDHQHRARQGRAAPRRAGSGSPAAAVWDGVGPVATFSGC
jgi:hypothetical protein